MSTSNNHCRETYLVVALAFLSHRFGGVIIITGGTYRYYLQMKYLDNGHLQLVTSGGERG